SGRSASRVRGPCGSCGPRFGSLDDMKPVLVYHNPSCSKSRGALDLLRERSVEVEVVEYLHHPPDRAALERILDAISDPPDALVRKDKRFKDLGLVASRFTTREAVVDLLLEPPEPMELP